MGEINRADGDAAALSGSGGESVGVSRGASWGETTRGDGHMGKIYRVDDFMSPGKDGIIRMYKSIEIIDHPSSAGRY
jgi:hypothetical protein